MNCGEAQRRCEAGFAMTKTLGLFLMLILSSSVPAIAQKRTPIATNDKTYPSQLSGTVVDTSDAVIAGATVQVRSANGAVERTTRSDANGSFVIYRLSAGNYRLVVSNPGFESKEIPVDIGPLSRRPRCASLWLWPL
jgi:hypothetical protein